MTVPGASGVPYYYDPYSSYPQCREESETVCISESCAASYINPEPPEPERTQSFTISENNPQGYVDAAREGVGEGASAIFRILTGCALVGGAPDRDAGTDVEEEADGYEFLDDADIHDEDADGIPDEWEVPPDDGHEVDADGDADEVGDDGETDEGAVCTPQPPIVETLFTSGVLFQTDNETTPGSLILNGMWTCEWKANSGLRPDEMPAPCTWTLYNLGGATVGIEVDPVTGLNALHINSIGTERVTYFAIDSAGISNSTGWVVEAAMRLESSEAIVDDLACGFEIADFDSTNGRDLYIDIRNDRVKNIHQSGLEHLMVTTDDLHIYQISGINNDFQVEVDRVLAIPGTGQMNQSIGANRIRWGDNVDVNDSESYWFTVRYYDGGTSVPNYPSGTFEGIYDLGSRDTNLGAGAFISYLSTPPADTNITFETRSGNPTTSGDTCSDPVTWLNPWTPISGFGGIISSSTTPARCLGVKVTLNAPTQLLEFATNFCNY